MTPPLPPHASLVASPDVWMESEVIDQLARVAALPACVRAVGMPDLHPGRGIPIGAAFLFEGRVLPDLAGGDLGCGVLLLAAAKAGPRGDALERRVLAALDAPLLEGVARDALLEAAWCEGPRGLARVPGIPDEVAELAAALGPALDGAPGPSGAPPDAPGLVDQLGTVGGGNHFLEVSRVDRVEDRAFAARIGLARDASVVLVHTGSRALGGAVAARHAGRVLAGDDADAYVADQRGAVRFAKANRLLVAARVLRAAGLGRADRIAGAFDLVHNAIEPTGGAAFLHRKGAAPARRDEPTVVLGSRGAPSWVMRGLGAEASLCCVAHGAGRRMGRAEAHSKLRARHTRASLARTALGGRVLCDEAVLMYEEHPDAYKPIEPVVASLEAAGAARRVAALVPLVTVKR